MTALSTTRRGFMNRAGAMGMLAASPALARKESPPPLEPLLALPGHELVALIAAREVSSEETMQLVLAHIGAHNHRFNAVVALRNPEALIAQAREMDDQLSKGLKPGPLFGLPWAVKDLKDVIGIPSTAGSMVLRHNIPEEEGIMVARLRAAGALFIGKTNVPEFGFGSHTVNSVYGATRNAYAPDRSAGGSSGGAAAGLALRMLPIADGSDFGGSLRNPAGWNNVFGFRPGISVVPQEGVEQWIPNMGVLGPMGRTVEDLALLLSVQAGQHDRSPLSLDVQRSAFLGSLASEPKGTRIGWLGDWGGKVPHDPEVLEICKNSLSTFSDLGCDVEEARVEADVEQAWQAMQTLRSWMLSWRVAPFADDPQTRDLLRPQAMWEIANGRDITGRDAMEASKVRTAFAAAFEKLFDRFDFLVAPSVQIFPFPIEQLWPTEINGQTMRTYHEWMLGNFLITLTGLPALAAPAGFSADGLPAGIQIVGRRGAELACLKLARAYEAAAKSRIDRLPPALA